MAKILIHNLLIVTALSMVAICFTFSANATSEDTTGLARRQICSSLVNKAKSATFSGNSKLAEKFWLQAKSMDPSMKKPSWLASTTQQENCNENKFESELRNMPYGSAKTKLDKKLVFAPCNDKLRLVYFELAKANKDKLEAEHHRLILGLHKQDKNNYWNFLKYLLSILISTLIIREIKTILKSY